MEKVFEVKVRPGARQTKITKEEEGALHIDVKGPPSEGKANQELIKFLSKEYKEFVTIIKRFSKKNKKVKIAL